ncbi:MAG: SDR family NAD(P)-dependent oxidoreductase, partial [Amylibacter sp.]|nr:SDR family NAD(P)-dependent oxidoreductase [Amylibacter sp.]
MSALFDLSGKTALITGASKGMGLSMATALAEHGANVVISSRKQNELDEAAAKINDDIGRNCAIGIASNIGDKIMVKDLVAQTKDKVGPINVLVGNAGVNVHYGSTHEIPDEAYEKIMSANVQSQLWLAREAHG